MKNRRLSAVVVLLLLLLGGVVLFTIDPCAGPGVYPPCIFRTVTGLYCPGCGSTRALARCLHLDLPGAFSYNPLVVLALPYLAWHLVIFLRNALTDRPPTPAKTRPALILTITILVLLFWVARNLPFQPFTSLAPTERVEDSLNKH